MNKRDQVIQWWMRNPVVCQFGIACLVLGLGILVYVMDRDPSRVYFLPDQLSLFSRQPPVFGWVGRQLPDFAHVYSFTLLSCAALQPGTRGVLAISAFWLLADIGFELGQHPAFARSVAEHIPDWFEHFPVLENARSHFIEGGFDPYDVAGFGLGALCACLTVMLMPRYEPRIGRSGQG